MNFNYSLLTKLCYTLNKNYFFLPTQSYEKSHSKLSKNETVCMCKEGWCFGLGQEGGSLCEGERNCLKYLEKGWNIKESRVNKN